jgi:DNA-binding FadR family transcriptional regulator
MCTRITEKQLQQLDAINSTLEANMRNHRSTVKNDIEFHTVLLEATQNPVLMDMIALLEEHFRTLILHRPSVILRNPARVVAEHQRIIDALRTRNQAAAHEALVDHLQQRATFT